jgi:hypothetical protein
MRRLRWGLAAGLCAAAVLTVAPAAGAQEAANAHKLELARHMFASLNMDQMMDAMTRSVSTNMLAQLRKANPALSEEQARAISDATAEAMRDLTPKMMDRIVPLYASTFTEKELEDVTAFYDSPSGRAMMAKMPALMAKMGPMMMEMTPDMIVDVQRRVCAKTDCTKLNQPKS